MVGGEPLHAGQGGEGFVTQRRSRQALNTAVFFD